MNNNNKIIYGLLITMSIFLTATLISANINLGIKSFPSFCVTLSIELLLSVIAIMLFNKQLSFRVAMPALKTIIKPVALALAVTIVINISLTVITKLLGQKIETPKALLGLSPVQVILFVFFYASIAEELLFRGFLLNFLKPLEQRNIAFFKRKISVPVIISAIAFGLAHLVLLHTDVSGLFICRIIIFTTCLGLVAGYYQEKYSNHIYAVMMHMAGNSLAVIAAFAMK
jgi:membrane protease YdiL (CAAX protease family)